MHRANFTLTQNVGQHPFGDVSRRCWCIDYGEVVVQASHVAFLPSHIAFDNSLLRLLTKFQVSSQLRKTAWLETRLKRG
jgi:hypothetical protein